MISKRVVEERNIVVLRIKDKIVREEGRIEEGKCIKIGNGKLQRVAPVGAYREIFMGRLP